MRPCLSSAWRRKPIAADLSKKPSSEPMSTSASGSQKPSAGFSFFESASMSAAVSIETCARACCAIGGAIGA